MSAGKPNAFIAWSQLEEGELVWLVTSKGDDTLDCLDLHDAGTPWEVNDSFTVLRGGETLREGDPKSIRRTYR